MISNKLNLSLKILASFLMLSLLFKDQEEKLTPSAYCKSITSNQTEKNNCLVNKFNYAENNHLIKIAVIDTGIDASHVSLQSYISPIGYDFTNTMLKTPFVDNLGHGTHVAGIIVSEIDKLADQYQIVLPIEITSVKYFDYNTEGGDLGGAMIQLLGANQQFDILNISSAGNEFYNSTEYAAFNLTNLFGIQVVIAAGNLGTDLDQIPNYPCSYDFKNIICVGNLFPNNEINFSSNFGSKVDVFEMGTQVVSTWPRNQFATLTGTSMAVPKVTAKISYIKVMGNLSINQYLLRNKFSAFTNQLVNIEDIKYSVFKENLDTKRRLANVEY